MAHFYCLIAYGVCKKRKYCNRMSEKKNSLLLTNVHVLYVLEDKTITRNFRLSVCLPLCLYVRELFMGHNNFRRSLWIQTKFCGFLLCTKCRSSIEIQSKIMIMILILILNRILTLKKTLRNDTKFGAYL